MESGKGSPIIFVPILLLLLIAGAAAGLGIALGADDSESTASAPVVTAEDLGEECTPQPGARPTSPAQLRPWLAAVRACLQSELAEVPGYAGAGIEGFSQDVVVVRWEGEPPTVVVERVAVVAGDSATVVGTRTVATTVG